MKEDSLGAKAVIAEKKWACCYLSLVAMHPSLRHFRQGEGSSSPAKNVVFKIKSALKVYRVLVLKIPAV